MVTRSQLVVGFPIDEGVLSLKRLYDEAIVSPGYDVWNLIDECSVSTRYLERFLPSPRALFSKSKLRARRHVAGRCQMTSFSLLMVPLSPLLEHRRTAAILDQADHMPAQLRQEPSGCRQ